MELHGLDTETHVFFYEQDFYVLSNFSAFALDWRNLRFDTAEAAYHYEKFIDGGARAEVTAQAILYARSAHDAFKIAEANKAQRRPDWDDARQKFVAISPSGRAARDAAVASVSPLIAEVVTALGADKVRAVLPVLRELRVRLENDDG